MIETHHENVPKCRIEALPDEVYVASSKRLKDPVVSGWNFDHRLFAGRKKRFEGQNIEKYLRTIHGQIVIQMLCDDLNVVFVFVVIVIVFVFAVLHSPLSWKSPL